jgi:calcineurin-like phosphoesterase family protein
MSNIFFTSDEHYHHTNILKYCNRPYSSVEEMNDALIAEHNKVVKNADKVYHLGDFTFKSPRVAANVFRRLNGNHDEWVFDNGLREAFRDIEHFKGIKDYEELKFGRNGEKIHLVLFHFPLLTWHKAHRGSIMLHGHTHSNIDRINEDSNTKRFDIGVDSAAKALGEYRPFSLEEVISMAKKRADNTLDFGKE